MICLNVNRKSHIYILKKFLQDNGWGGGSTDKIVSMSIVSDSQKSFLFPNLSSKREKMNRLTTRGGGVAFLVGEGLFKKVHTKDSNKSSL